MVKFKDSTFIGKEKAMIRVIRFGLRFSICLILAEVFFSTSVAFNSTATPQVRRFEFEYKTTVKDIPAQATRVDLWIPVPHDNPFQKITELKVDSPYPYKINQSQYGNKILHIELDKPAQITSFTVIIRFNATRKEHVQERLQQSNHYTINKEHDSDIKQWLEPDRLVPIDGKIKLWAQQVIEAAGARTDLEKARAIYNHVISTVKYDKTGQGWGRGDIYYACDMRRGNCTDFHAIFIGYCRAIGIPARFAIGFQLPADRGAGQISGYHCWAEFYLKGVGWVPIDASEAAKNPNKREYFFGTHDENRVEFTIGRDLVLPPRQAGDPLNYFIYPYLEVDGKPFSSIEKSFTYRDLDIVENNNWKVENLNQTCPFIEMAEKWRSG